MKLHAFFISGTDGDEWSASCFGRFISRKRNSNTRGRKLGGPQSRSDVVAMRNICAPVGNQTHSRFVWQCCCFEIWPTYLNTIVLLHRSCDRNNRSAEKQHVSGPLIACWNKEIALVRRSTNQSWSWHKLQTSNESIVKEIINRRYHTYFKHTCWWLMGAVSCVGTCKC
jgi:hypothetical protein